MSKLLKLEILSCRDCPYCQYNGDYGRSYDSGFDCHHPDVKGSGRIVDDYNINSFNKQYEEYQESLKTLFPKEKPDIEYPFTIPSWCPLPELNKGKA